MIADGDSLGVAVNLIGEPVLPSSAAKPQPTRYTLMGTEMPSYGMDTPAPRLVWRIGKNTYSGMTD